MFLPHFDILSELLLNRPIETRDLFVSYKIETKIVKIDMTKVLKQIKTGNQSKCKHICWSAYYIKKTAYLCYKERILLKQILIKSYQKYAYATYMKSILITILFIQWNSSGKSWPSFQTDIQKMKFYGFPSSHQCRGLTREQNQCQKNSLFWLKIKPKRNSFGYKTKICLERKFIDNFCLLVLCKHQPKITSINCCNCIP